MTIRKNFETKEDVSCIVFKRYNKLIDSHVTNLHDIIRKDFDFRILS